MHQCDLMIFWWKIRGFHCNHITAKCRILSLNLALVCFQHFMVKMRERWCPSAADVKEIPRKCFENDFLKTTRTTKTHRVLPAECHSLLDLLAFSTPHKPPRVQLSCLSSWPRKQNRKTRHWNRKKSVAVVTLAVVKEWASQGQRMRWEFMVSVAAESPLAPLGPVTNT